MGNELRDLIDEVETLARAARTTLANAGGDKATAAGLQKGADDAMADLDQVLARIDRAKVDGVLPR